MIHFHHSFLPLLLRRQTHFEQGEIAVSECWHPQHNIGEHIGDLFDHELLFDIDGHARFCKTSLCVDNRVEGKGEVDS